ncbi:OmpA family protein [Rhodopila sp.]|uniref:OmpA family protein n=1 Tax=Rhodopila sp. TaxID=2480087 RepID=UPI003D0C3AC8
MSFRSMLAAATILALPIAATAQPITGPYVGGGAGVNIMHDEDAQITGGGRTFGGRLEPRVGPAFDLSVGYGLANGLRAEIEGDYRYNTFRGIGAGGQEQKFGPMVNVLYDISALVPFLKPYVNPYVGVGAGWQWVQERNVYATSGNTLSRAQNATKGDFAYQGIVGVAYPIKTVPGLDLTADYRFMGLAGDRTYPGTETVGARTLPASLRLNNDYNHTILIGFRYRFGAPTPPPPAAPAAVPASPVSRSYLVFFDWDKAVLTERARQIVSEAAANSTKVQYTQLEVNGYTDTSGTATYNQGLSIRRAQAVAAELVKDGVPKAAISIQGFGETHLLVQTGPGVREPQNRRVEIIIR